MAISANRERELVSQGIDPAAPKDLASRALPISALPLTTRPTSRRTTKDIKRIDRRLLYGKGGVQAFLKQGPFLFCTA